MGTPVTHDKHSSRVRNAVLSKWEKGPRPDQIQTMLEPIHNPVLEHTWFVVDFFQLSETCRECTFRQSHDRSILFEQAWGNLPEMPCERDIAES